MKHMSLACITFFIIGCGGPHTRSFIEYDNQELNNMRNYAVGFLTAVNSNQTATEQNYSQRLIEKVSSRLNSIGIKSSGYYQMQTILAKVNIQPTGLNWPQVVVEVSKVSGLDYCIILDKAPSRRGGDWFSGYFKVFDKNGVLVKDYIFEKDNSLNFDDDEVANEAVRCLVPKYLSK